MYSSPDETIIIENISSMSKLNENYITMDKSNINTGSSQEDMNSVKIMTSKSKLNKNYINHRNVSHDFHFLIRAK